MRGCFHLFDVRVEFGAGGAFQVTEKISVIARTAAEAGRCAEKDLMENHVGQPIYICNFTEISRLRPVDLIAEVEDETA